MAPHPPAAATLRLPRRLENLEPRYHNTATFAGNGLDVLSIHTGPDLANPSLSVTTITGSSDGLPITPFVTNDADVVIDLSINNEPGTHDVVLLTSDYSTEQPVGDLPVVRFVGPSAGSGAAIEYRQGGHRLTGDVGANGGDVDLSVVTTTSASVPARLTVESGQNVRRLQLKGVVTFAYLTVASGPAGPVKVADGYVGAGGASSVFNQNSRLSLRDSGIIFSQSAGADASLYADINQGYVDASHAAGFGVGIVLAPTRQVSFYGVALAADDLVLDDALPGDADLNRKVDFNDLLRLAKNYQNLSAYRWTLGNFDFVDGINFNDLLRLARNYGSSLASDESASVAVGRRRRDMTEWTRVG